MTMTLLRAGRRSLEMVREQWFDMKIWRGSVSTHLYLEEDRSEGLIDFRMGRPGFMKVFEGSWQIHQLDTHIGAPLSQVRQPIPNEKNTRFTAIGQRLFVLETLRLCLKYLSYCYNLDLITERATLTSFFTMVVRKSFLFFSFLPNL